MPAIRPSTFDDFHGQAKSISLLRSTVAAAQIAGTPLRHILFAGPAGLGKTTLAMSVLPTEMKTTAKMINCAAIEKVQDFTVVLTTIKAGEILFLDELHALIPAAREHLLTVMEDATVNVKIGEPGSEQILTVKLPTFTIIGATTRQGMLDGPMRTRFSHTITLVPYTDDEMAEVLDWMCQRRGYSFGAAKVKQNIIVCAHGCARLAANLLDGCIDACLVESGTTEVRILSESTVVKALLLMGYVDGFDATSILYLNKLVDGAKGLKSLSKILGEDPRTLEEVIEPWLLRQGYIRVESKGRSLTTAGLERITALNALS